MFKFLMKANRRSIKKHAETVAYYLKWALSYLKLDKNQQLSSEEIEYIFRFILNQPWFKRYTNAAVYVYRFIWTFDKVVPKDILFHIVHTHYEQNVEPMDLELVGYLKQDIDEIF